MPEHDEPLVARMAQTGEFHHSPSPPSWEILLGGTIVGSSLGSRFCMSCLFSGLTPCLLSAQSAESKNLWSCRAAGGLSRLALPAFERSLPNGCLAAGVTQTIRRHTRHPLFWQDGMPKPGSRHTQQAGTARWCIGDEVTASRQNKPSHWLALWYGIINVTAPDSRQAQQHYAAFDKCAAA